MGKQHYIIQRQQLSVQLYAGSDWHHIQQQLRQLLRGPLLERMSEVLDQYDDPAQVTEIEQLEIDLGALSGVDWEAQFAERFVPAFTSAIRRICTLPVDQHLTGVDKHEDLINRRPTTEKRHALLLFFLTHGYLPWWAPTKNQGELAAVLVDELSVEKGEYGPFQQLLPDFIAQHEDHRTRALGLLSTESWPVFMQFLLDSANPLIVDFLIWVLRVLDKQEYSGMPRSEMCQHLLFLRDNTSLRTVFSLRLTELLLTKEEHKAFSVITKFISILSLTHQTEVIKQAGAKAGIAVSFPPRISPLLKGLVDYEAQLPLKLYGDLTQAKALEQKEPDTDDTAKIPEDVIYLENAGLVLLHPYLPMLFEAVAYLRDGQFYGEGQQNEALFLLHWLVYGEQDAIEYELVLNKILCAWPFEKAPQAIGKLDVHVLSEAKKLLEAVLNHWKPLQGSSLYALRETFLQRPGCLEYKENHWELTVEQKSVDILLQQLPWGLGIIKYPWMSEPLFVNWT